MESLRRKIESGELTTLLTVVHEYCQVMMKSSPTYDEQYDNGVFLYTLHAANTPRYFGRHEHKKQAKLLAIKDFLHHEAPELLELFERLMAIPNGWNHGRPRSNAMAITDIGFGKCGKARACSDSASHPYSRSSPASVSTCTDPLQDPQRRSVAICRVLGEIDRGEVITACDAFESLQDGLGIQRAVASCSQFGNHLFSVSIGEGNRVYGQAMHALKNQAKLLAYEDAIREISPEISSLLRSTEFESYNCSKMHFQSNEDLLHEYVSRNFRTSVAFCAGNNERGEIVMQAKVHGIVVGTGVSQSLKTAQSEAINSALADLCPYLVKVLQPRDSRPSTQDPRLFIASESNDRSHNFSSASHPVPAAHSSALFERSATISSLSPPPVPSAHPSALFERSATISSLSSPVPAAHSTALFERSAKISSLSPPPVPAAHSSALFERSATISSLSSPPFSPGPMSTPFQRSATPPSSDLPPRLPVPAFDSSYGSRLQSSRSYPRDQLIKPMDFGMDYRSSPAVANLFEKLESGAITTLSAMFAAYLQLVERTTAAFDMRTLRDGTHRCDVIINGKLVGFGESIVKKHAKADAIRNAMQSLCPTLIRELISRYPSQMIE